jgi:hypothetical protein
LGKKDGNRWYDVGIDSQMLQVLQDRYTIFIPEKFNREPGNKDYFDDLDERERYTFESIVILGQSEGALILPVLYHQIDVANISLLVSVAGGGLSLHEKDTQFL